jgi:hypothetical protein
MGLGKDARFRVALLQRWLDMILEGLDILSFSKNQIAAPKSET